MDADIIGARNGIERTLRADAQPRVAVVSKRDARYVCLGTVLCAACDLVVVLR